MALHRPARRRLVQAVGLTCIGALALGACGGDKAETVTQPTYKVDTKGLEGPEALGPGRRRETTTTTSTTTTSTTVATSTTFALPGGATCADFALLLEQPLIGGRDDLSKVDKAKRAAAFLRIAASAPDELRFGWEQVMAVERGEPGADRNGATVALDQSLSWAEQTCPQPKPVWSCTVRTRTDPPPPPAPPATTTTTTMPVMTKPGETTTPPPPTTTTTTIPPGSPQPDQVLNAPERAAKPIVLDKNDATVLYGFVKAEQVGNLRLIERTIEAVKGPGGWNRGVAFACAPPPPTVILPSS